MQKPIEDCNNKGLEKRLRAWREMGRREEEKRGSGRERGEREKERGDVGGWKGERGSRKKAYCPLIPLRRRNKELNYEPRTKNCGKKKNTHMENTDRAKRKKEMGNWANLVAEDGKAIYVNSTTGKYLAEAAHLSVENWEEYT